VKYLLDVNALLAWHHAGSPHHEAFHRWCRSVGAGSLVSCAHAELGFLRVSMQVFGYSRQQAQAALGSIRRELGGFVAQAPAPVLPVWAGTPARVSDAWLVQLARAEGLQLATFDRGIPDAVTIR
jgi:predicted nucleic acid-binding protein